MAPMANGMLVGLRCEEDGRLVGRAGSDSVSFMPLRSAGWPPGRPWATLADDAEWRVVAEPEEQLLSAIVRLHIPELEIAFQDGDWNLASPSDGSWARSVRAADGDLWLAQAGSRRLWDDYQAAALAWERLGRPDWDRYGLTVCPDGSHQVWLDGPDSALVWQLPRLESRAPAGSPGPPRSSR